MTQLVASLLGLAVLAVLAVNVTHRFERNLEIESYNARAAQAYVDANAPSPGVLLTVSSLEALGLLTPGFPATNPFGQTPEIFVGRNGAAIATYSAPPVNNYLAPFGMSSASTVNLQAVALLEAQDIAVAQAGFPGLGGAVLSGTNFITPLEGLTIPTANSFSGIPLPSGVVFADLINVIAAPSLSVPGNSGYTPVTGD
jgi:hypothetical protein